MSIGIFYGSTTGVTEQIAEKIGTLLDAKVFHAGDIDKILEFDTAILATSTWGMGDIQDDWIEPLEKLRNLNLSGKKIGLVGVGDQEAFSSSFVDGMRDLYIAVTEANAEVIGSTSIEGYSFDESKAVEGDKFVGLVIDDSNQSNLTDERIDKWIVNFK